MQIDRPEWFDKRECPCGLCDGAFLLFVMCRSCSRLFSRCEETHAMFPDPVNLDEASLLPEESQCPVCGTPLAEVVFATGEEIQAAGFRWQLDYK